jgi:hypothetical protein
VPISRDVVPSRCSPTEQVSCGLAFAVAARNYGPIPAAGRCIRRGAARGHRDSQTIRDRLIDRHCLTPMLLFAAGSFALAFACMRQTASMSVTADSTIAPLKVGGSLRGVHPQGASRRVALMGIIEAIPRKDQRAMADGKHEDKKPEITRPTEVIGEHKTEPTTAPTTAHPASVRPGAGPIHFDCVEPYACSCTSYRVYPGTIGGCNRRDHADARRFRAHCHLLT